MRPLKTLNDIFVAWAKEKRIEATMTSQIIMLEWFLTRKFKEYFVDHSQTIQVVESKPTGIPFYNEDAKGVQTYEHVLLMRQSEKDSKGTVVLRGEHESVVTANVSFLVRCPKLKLDQEGKEEFLNMLRYWIDRYRIANKTYNIFIEE